MCCVSSGLTATARCALSFELTASAGMTLERDPLVDELVEGAAEVYEEVQPHLASSPAD